MFKENVIENKKKKALEKKQKFNSIVLRNKFLGEWASTILELNDNKKKSILIKLLILKRNNISSLLKKYSKILLRII